MSSNFCPLFRRVNSGPKTSKHCRSSLHKAANRLTHQFGATIDRRSAAGRVSRQADRNDGRRCATLFASSKKRGEYSIRRISSGETLNRANSTAAIDAALASEPARRAGCWVSWRLCRVDRVIAASRVLVFNTSMLSIRRPRRRDSSRVPVARSSRTA